MVNTARGTPSPLCTALQGTVSFGRSPSCRQPTHSGLIGLWIFPRDACMVYPSRQRGSFPASCGGGDQSERTFHLPKASKRGSSGGFALHDCYILLIGLCSLMQAASAGASDDTPADRPPPNAVPWPGWIKSLSGQRVCLIGSPFGRKPLLPDALGAFIDQASAALSPAFLPQVGRLGMSRKMQPYKAC